MLTTPSKALPCLNFPMWFLPSSNLNFFAQLLSPSPCLSCPSPPPFAAAGSSPDSPGKLPKSPTFPAAQGAWPDECSICYENAVDTVIYACGHMCLCYTCGLKLKKMSNACCPICRRQIKDIIKTYRST